VEVGGLLAGLALGLLLGAAGTALWLRSRAGTLDRDLALSRERLAQAQAVIEEQKGFLAASRKEMEDAFHSLAASALRGNTEQFLQLAQQKWEATRDQSTQDLDARKQAIESLLAPLKESLGRLDARTGDLEKARESAYRLLEDHLEHLHETTRRLEEKTTKLATALRSGSRVSGRWGEIALRNVAELAGMSEHCDFAEQETVADGRRPDMMVRLPGNRFIAVDSKTPLTAYLESLEAKSEPERLAALDRHVAAVRNHVRSLAGREYAETIDGGVDLVVLFLPGDPFLAAAFVREPELQVEALRSKVLLATPTTLVALLRTVAIYWQQQSLAENAERIAATARELYERAAIFGEHLGGLGANLRRAVESYNNAVASFESRLLPSGRKLEEFRLADHSKRRLDPPELIDETPREPNEQLTVDFDRS
jgi:DNA recombination protein RmuC